MRVDAKITYLHNTLRTPFITWLQSNFGWMFAQAQLDATLGQAYVYDDAQLGSTPVLLGEYGNGGSNPAGRSEYIWLPTEDGRAIPIGLYKEFNLSAIHTDHLGTPRRITNWNNNTDWQWPYSAFGEDKPVSTLTATTDPILVYTTDAATNTQLQAGLSPVSFNFRFPGQYFDSESQLNYNYFRSYQATQGRYTQADPIGLSGGLNRFAYVGGNPLSYVDPLGLTQADIDSAFSAARAMMAGSRFPSSVGTWSQAGKGGKFSFGSDNIYVDRKYLECLDDGEAGALLSTVLHELTHFNQSPLAFGADNLRERITSGNSSRAQDNADRLLWNNNAIVQQYLKNRNVGQNTCQCKK